MGSRPTLTPLTRSESPFMSGSISGATSDDPRTCVASWWRCSEIRGHRTPRTPHRRRESRPDRESEYLPRLAYGYFFWLLDGGTTLRLLVI